MAATQPGAQLSTHDIQRMLEENHAWIKTIISLQNSGRIPEIPQYQQRLHNNLMQLANIADKQPGQAPGAAAAPAVAQPQANNNMARAQVPQAAPTQPVMQAQGQLAPPPQAQQQPQQQQPHFQGTQVQQAQPQQAAMPPQQAPHLAQVQVQGQGQMQMGGTATATQQGFQQQLQYVQHGQQPGMGHAPSAAQGTAQLGYGMQGQAGGGYGTAMGQQQQQAYGGPGLQPQSQVYAGAGQQGMQF